MSGGAPTGRRHRISVVAMKEQKQTQCMWYSDPARRRAYCHLFGADCAVCQFNAAARHTAKALPQHYRLSREHIWLAPAARKGTVLAGIDSFLAHVLYHARSVVLSKPKTHLEKGKMCAWIIDLVGIVPLRSPISGSVIANNQRLAEQPGLLTEAPYGAGWLFEIEAAPGWQDGLLEHDTATAFVEQSHSALKDRALAAGGSGLAATVTPDGGVVNVRELVQRDEHAYLQLVLDTLALCRKM